jgi:SAM-dependent methyltransferase
MARLFDRMDNLWWETRLGISTRGVAASHPDHPDAWRYATLPYSTVYPILRHLALGPSDVFVDIGCGKGRVLCAAARQPVGKVIGIDLSAERCHEATENARRMRGRRAPIEVVNALAQDFDYSTATALFLFNPFGPETLEAVLNRIAKDRRGAPVRFAYAFPLQDGVFQAQPWLERGEYWQSANTGLGKDVIFYSSRDSG